MIKTCNSCWETYDTERRAANEYFCPKCLKNKRRVEDGMETS